MNPSIDALLDLQVNAFHRLYATIIFLDDLAAGHFSHGYFVSSILNSS